ncbi:MAG: STAS domain-containing protein [Verrucomicrobiales bacterium]|jgi:anti-anti-sigma factor|nr:STAS domain-containing protein [Verrucomicrobiales bacterium]
MTHTIADDTLTVQIPGDVLSTTVEGVRQEVSTLLALPTVKLGCISRLQLDLQRAKMIDSAGVNLLVGLVRACQTANLKLGVIVSSRVVHRTLLFTRLDRHVDIKTTEDAAKSPVPVPA